MAGPSRAVDLMAARHEEVAVKVLRRDAGLDVATINRFRGELAIMAKIAHPHVMAVLASGDDENLGFWFAMPLALGSLSDDLHAGPMPEDKVVAVMRSICAGLDHMHRNGVLHRDLKPDNVLRTPGGWAIADFGLARDMARSTRITETGQAMGTRFYMPPEQWDDAKNVTPAADIYSAGKILQALLIGETPVTDIVPPGKLAAVVRRAISADPSRRHQNAAELLSAIEIAIRPSGSWEPPGDKAKRLRAALAAAVDTEAAMEVIDWADEVDDSSIGEFAFALSAMLEVLARAWWEANPASFAQVFGVFGQALDRSYKWENCDPIANWARQAVSITRDPHIVREAIRGLAVLSYHHTRWYVRDVTAGILQQIRDDAEAASALEGLQMAGPEAAEWTAGRLFLDVLHPILRTGIPQIGPPPAAGTMQPLENWT